MPYGLVKSGPSYGSWADHMAVGREPWDGVFFYHSVTEKKIVGTMDVVREADPDGPDRGEKFFCVDVPAVASLARPGPVTEIKSNPKLEEMILLRQDRLSVSPVRETRWQEIITMAGGLQT